jgi:hypothetical protein
MLDARYGTLWCVLLSPVASRFLSANKHPSHSKVHRNVAAAICNLAVVKELQMVLLAKGAVQWLLDTMSTFQNTVEVQVGAVAVCSARAEPSCPPGPRIRSFVGMLLLLLVTLQQQQPFPGNRALFAMRVILDVCFAVACVVRCSALSSLRLPPILHPPPAPPPPAALTRSPLVTLSSTWRVTTGVCRRTW